MPQDRRYNIGSFAQGWRRPIMKSFSIVAVAAVVSTVALADAPAMTIGSLEMKLSQEDCIVKGTSVMKGAGMTQNFEVVGHTVYGETGDYTAAIRCESAKTVAFFVVAGPLSKVTEELHGDLKKAFGGAPSSN
jgi:hypothetical protein